MKSLLIVATCALALSGPSHSAPAKKAANVAKSAAPVMAKVPDNVQAALDRMAEAMKAMPSFELRSDITNEDVLDNGQKLQNSGVLTIRAKRPDRLYVDINSEQRKRRIYYDGRQVTIYGPATGYYASVDAPPTTRAMLDALAVRNGVETPLADLFEWGASGVRLDKISSAMYAGRDRISDVICEHYAFRQPGVDWQIWISTQGAALPCKLVIVNTDDEAQPQTTMLFAWSPGGQVSDTQYVFTPPAGAQRIAIAQVTPSSSEARSK